jgi:hypothetical protein
LSLQPPTQGFKPAALQGSLTMRYPAAPARSP